MNNIFLTGASGFVGTSLLNYFKGDNIQISSRSKEYIFHGAKNIIHLAGKAHDLKKTSKTDEYYKVNTELTKKVFNAFFGFKR